MAIQSNFPAIKPTLLLDFANTKQLDPRVTFTRASTGTFYGTQTAKAEENLLLRSQEFDNAYWTKTRLTITANATTAPDGTSTAESAIPTAEALGHRFSRNVTVSSSGDLTWSIFAKANGYNFIAINARSGGTDRNCFFNVSTGAVATNSSGGTASIVDVGNGWYRCSVVRASEGTTAVNEISVCETDNVSSYTADGTSGLFLWGAQLEQRSAVTAYTPTTTQPITNYIPVLQTAAAGVPRFDHNPTTFESLGLLIEGQRTNLLTYSEQFDNAAWTKTRSSITSNTIVAPDGTLTGDKLVEDTAASDSHFVSQTAAIPISTVHTISVYAKAAERSIFWLKFANSGAYTQFNLIAGTATSFNGATGSITPAGNGWYRCVVTSTSAAANDPVRLFLNDGSGNVSYTGDGYSGIFIWGAQLEAGAFPTSYIPTTTAQVTRSADAASMTGANFSSWYRADEGTLYAEATALQNNNGLIAEINSGSPTDRIFLACRFNTVSGTAGGVAVNSVTQTNSFGNFTFSSANKSALAYKADDFAGTINGQAVTTDSSGTTPAVNRLDIGVNTSDTSLKGHLIKKLAYYPKRLANAEIVALTAS
jgi:hypothetical protein